MRIVFLQIKGEIVGGAIEEEVKSRIGYVCDQSHYYDDVRLVERTAVPAVGGIVVVSIRLSLRSYAHRDIS